MIIKIETAGFCFDNGKPTQRAGSAIKLMCQDEHGRKAERSISQPAGNATQPRAELNAALLGLMSVVAEHRGAEVEIIVSRYANQVLEKNGDKFKSKPKKNMETVEDLRKWAGYYSNLAISVGQTKIVELAKECADSQEPSDTQTTTVI